MREVERENDFLKKSQRSSPENNGRGSSTAWFRREERAVPRPVDLRPAGYFQGPRITGAARERDRDGDPAPGHPMVQLETVDAVREQAAARPGTPGAVFLSGFLLGLSNSKGVSDCSPAGARRVEYTVIGGHALALVVGAYSGSEEDWHGNSR